MSAAEFINRHPDYSPRKGSEFYGLLLLVAKEMVLASDLEPDIFRQLFPKEPMPDY
jgi:hypothetical protein